MSSLLEKAKTYVNRDRVSVIPVGPDKRPLISWKEFQTRYATEDELEKWFGGESTAQIGVVTGKISNLTVVDIEFGGDPSFLPQETFIVKTGGGGWHYYYRYAEGMMNKARIRELVDIRSEGGYVVAPPSKTEKGEYSVIKRLAPVEFPRHLFPDQFSQVPISTPAVASNLPQDEEYLGYGPGQRNDQMARYVGRVLTRIHPALWDTEALKIINEANQKNTPPLPQNELLATFRSIKSREIKNPSARDWKVKKEAPKEVFPDDGSDEILHMSEVAARNAIKIGDTFPFGMPYFDQALLGGPNPGDLIIIAGPTGNGKTLFAQDLTSGLMKGERECPVLFFSYEVLPQFVWQKYQKMGLGDKDPIFIPMKHTTGSIDWIDKKIVEAKKKFNIKVVCIDHLGFLQPRSGGANQKHMNANYSTYLTQVARDIKQIAIREELIIITPAHVRKPPAAAKKTSTDLNDISNSAGIAQEADIVFLIERERNPSPDAPEYYTGSTRIALVKNRKTGQSVVGWFNLFEGRFCWDSKRNKQEEAWRAVDKPDVSVPKKEIVVEEVDPVIISEKEEATEDDLFAELLKASRDEPF